MDSSSKPRCAVDEMLKGHSAAADICIRRGRSCASCAVPSDLEDIGHVMLVLVSLIAGSFVLLQLVSASWWSLGLYWLAGCIVIGVRFSIRKGELDAELNQLWANHVRRFGDGSGRSMLGNALETVGEIAGQLEAVEHPVIAIAANALGYLLGQGVKSMMSPEERASREELAAFRQYIDEATWMNCGSYLLLAGALFGMSALVDGDTVPSFDQRSRKAAQLARAEAQEQHERQLASQAKVRAAADASAVEALQAAVHAYQHASPDARDAAYRELTRVADVTQARRFSVCVNPAHEVIDLLRIEQVRAIDRQRATARRSHVLRKLEAQRTATLDKALRNASVALEGLNSTSESVRSRLNVHAVAGAT